MPCDTVTESTVDLANVDAQTLLDALRAAGWKVPNERLNAGEGFIAERGIDRLTWRPGQPAELRSNTTTPAHISRLYSAQVVRSTAKRNGWRLTETGPGQFLVQR